MKMFFWGVSICPFFQRCDQNRGMEVFTDLQQNPQSGLKKLRASWFEHHLGNDFFPRWTEVVSSRCFRRCT